MTKRLDGVEPRRPFFTIAQLAERWQCSEKSVRRTISSGDLVAHRFHGKLRISADDLRAYERIRRELRD